MQTVLLISSFVSASPIGAVASAFCLRRLGFNVVTLPTTLYGRHPGWGAQGGSVNDPQLFEDIWQGIAAQNIPFDAVMTGYMASPDHVDISCEIISGLTKDKNIPVLVDPIMGDNGALYISERTAHALIDHLIPKASLITPNLWEFDYITTHSRSQADTSPDVQDSRSVAHIARTAQKTFKKDMIVTSIPLGTEIGALCLKGQDVHYMGHEKFNHVPHGGGDALAALCLAHLLSGKPLAEALAYSVSSIARIMDYAHKHSSRELPLIQMQDSLINPPHLPLQSLSI